ncbi:MAG: MarR family winged helix-turn-helix transcriptional regulator [Candidatus Dormibacteraceae bacterium]
MPKNPRPTEAQMEAWRAFLMSSRSVRATLEHELHQERHLSMPAYEVLLRLWGAPHRRLRMLDLARATQLSRNGLSQLVGRMEAAGLVQRCGAVDDGRGTVCSLTGTGVRAFKRAAVVHVRGIREHFAVHFTDEEARQLTALLRRVLEDRDGPPSAPGAHPSCGEGSDSSDGLQADVAEL